VWDRVIDGTNGLNEGDFNEGDGVQSGRHA